MTVTLSDARIQAPTPQGLVLPCLALRHVPDLHFSIGYKIGKAVNRSSFVRRVVQNAGRRQHGPYRGCCQREKRKDFNGLQFRGRVRIGSSFRPR